MIKTPTWYVFHMYKPHMDATSLATRVATNQIGPEDSRVDAVTASASHKKNIYTVTLTNAELKGKKEINVTLAGLKGKIKDAAATILTSKEMHLCNSFAKPNELKEKTLDVKLSGANELFVTVPAMSVVTIEITA